MATSLNRNIGLKRIAVVIAAVTLVGSYIIMVAVEERVSKEEAFIGIPIIAVIFALLAYVLTRLLYWTIDWVTRGFNQSQEKNDQE